MLELYITICIITVYNGVFGSFSSNYYTLRVNGEAETGYYLTLDIGTPSQKMNLLIDTGSSNMAVSILPSPFRSYFNYNTSTTFQNENSTLVIKYTEGSWNGFLASDKIYFPTGPICDIKTQFSCITTSDNIFDESSEWEGILGMAYASISQPNGTIQPFFDTVVQTCNLSDIFSISFCGPFLHDNVQETKNGNVILGAYVNEFYEGDIMYAPVVKEWFYDIIITSLKIGNVTLDIPCTEFNTDRSIIDTGTTFLVFPPKIYNLVIEQIKKSISPSLNPTDNFWTNKDISCINPNDVTLFPTIEISLYHGEHSSFSLVISPNLYLLRYPFFSPHKICFKFAIGSSDKGSIIGATVLKGFYVVFDRKNKQIGFANSTCAAKSDQISIVKNVEIFKEHLKCKVDNNFSLQMLTNVILSLALVCLILFFILMLPYLRRCMAQRSRLYNQRFKRMAR